MAALWNRTSHYIFILWFFLSIVYLFFLAYSQPLQIGCLPYFHTWCRRSANLGCRSEPCCTWLAENAGCKKKSKIRHLGTIAQLCRGISSQLRHILTIGKNLLNSNISPTCPHSMVNFSPLAAEIGSLVEAPQQISMDFASWLHYCRRHHLYSAGQPSRWALAYVLVSFYSYLLTLWIAYNMLMCHQETTHSYSRW